jgi:hypothetical protein
VQLQFQKGRALLGTYVHTNKFLPGKHRQPTYLARPASVCVPSMFAYANLKSSSIFGHISAIVWLIKISSGFINIRHIIEHFFQIEVIMSAQKSCLTQYIGFFFGAKSCNLFSSALSHC